jgi:hypothetical protein
LAAGIYEIGCGQNATRSDANGHTGGGIQRPANYTVTVTGSSDADHFHLDLNSI